MAFVVVTQVPFFQSGVWGKGPGWCIYQIRGSKAIRHSYSLSPRDTHDSYAFSCLSWLASLSNSPWLSFILGIRLAQKIMKWISRFYSDIYGVPCSYLNQTSIVRISETDNTMNEFEAEKHLSLPLDSLVVKAFQVRCATKAWNQVVGMCQAEGKGGWGNWSAVGVERGAFRLSKGH